MTDASPQGNEARDVLPIVFLGNDDRFKDNDLQRSRDFRPHVLPADAPLPGRYLDNGPYSPAAKREQREREEEEAIARYEAALAAGLSDAEAREEGWPSGASPKASPATDPASGSDGASPTSPPASPADPASVEKESTPPPPPPPLVPPLI